jgi:hypothetical protein
MKARILFIMWVALIPHMAFGRLSKIVDPKTLIADSKLVFVGKVQSVKASGIATHLSYPTWEGVSFPWLSVEMEVLVPFKGVRKGEVVHVMMLSIAKSEKAQFMYSPPEVLEPDKGDIFFLCLGPTPLTNTFASLSAPYDENLSVFPLHRSHETSRDSMRDGGKQFLLDDKRFAPIWRLVNQAGEIFPYGVAKLRDTYTAEIRKVPTNEMVYLEWQTHTNAHNWVSDMPKGFSPTNSNIKK